MAKIRSVLEKLDSKSDDFETIKRLYGVNRYKCSRVNCDYYHQGFPFFKERNRHSNRHERPFRCNVAGCHMKDICYQQAKELQKHMFYAHHIDTVTDTDEPAYPNPHIYAEKEPDRHGKNHTNEEPFSCDKYGQRFTRKADRTRHIGIQHGDRKLICAGLLKDGIKWGCNKAFASDSSLTLPVPQGTKVHLALVEEKHQAADGDGSYLDENVFADQVGANAEALIATGRALPTFKDLVRLCGLVESTSSVHSRATSPPEGQKY
ncbi:hypothetical protein BDW62DRAFT_202121 [Aspergillus aurantiobrunneus]